MNNSFPRCGVCQHSGAVHAVLGLGLMLVVCARLQGASPVLWNVDFGADPVSLKSGPAAYGLEATDYWNAYYFPWTTLSHLENLRRSDGTVSGVGVTVAGADGGWGTGSADPMFLSYIYPNPGNSPAGGPILVTLTNLPPGYYDFYVYAHGADPGEYSVCQLSAAGIDYGTQSTANGPVGTLTEWIEGQQYVRYSDVRVPVGQPVSLSVGPSPEDNAALNGLQIVLRQPLRPTPEGCAPAPAGLVGWWKGDGNPTDWTGANDGTLAGNAGFGQGRVGQGFAFSGTGDGVLLGNPEALQLQDFTIETWIQRSSVTQASVDSGGGLILGGGYAGYAFGLFDDGTPYLTRVGIDAVSPVAAITDTELHHLAVTKVGSVVVFYLDGQAYPVSPYVTEYTFGSGFALGTLANAASNTFLGLIDEAAVYSRALSEAEVQAIFAAGAAGKCTGWACDLPGMVTWWQGEGDATDAMGNHNGSLIGGVLFEPGRVGSAFRFDGADDRVRIPAAPQLDLSGGPGFTMETWIRPDQVDSTMVVGEWHDTVQQVLGVTLALNVAWPTEMSPKLSFVANLYDTAGDWHILASEAGLLVPQQWSHVALTWQADNGLSRVFLNGSVVAEETFDFAGRRPRMVGDFWLGGRPPESQYGSVPYQGLMDEFSLYDRALSPAEVLGIYDVGAAGKCAGPVYRGPSARWAFDETEGTTAHDAIGTKHGTLSDSGAQFTEGGIRGNALRLDRGQGGLVHMGDVLDLEDTFTLVAWVKTEPNDTTESSVVLGRHAAGTANGYYVSLNRSGFLGQPGKALFVASDPAGQELVSTSPLNDGQWHQVVAVYDRGVGKRLYVDGQPAEASGEASAIVPNSVPFLVGGVSVGGVPQGFFTGWIDEVQVYERVLADAEIEYLYVNPEATQIPEALEPRIQTGLVNQTVNRGATVELQVTAAGLEPLTYVWSKDGAVREDATGPTLVLSEVQPADGGVYSVMVSNRWGTASSSATVTVLWPPTITVPPVGQSVALGGSVTLSVTADGAPPLSYAWLRNGRVILGATSRFLLLNNIAEAGSYQARVRNNDGTVLSDPVTISVYSGRIQAAVVANAMQFTVTGLQPGRNYVLEQSGSLPAGPAAWESMVTILNASESFQFTDPEPPAAGHRYYRLRVIP